MFSEAGLEALSFRARAVLVAGLVNVIMALMSVGEEGLEVFCLTCKSVDVTTCGSSLVDFWSEEVSWFF